MQNLLSYSLVLLVWHYLLAVDLLQPLFELHFLDKFTLTLLLFLLSESWSSYWLLRLRWEPTLAFDFWLNIIHKVRIRSIVERILFWGHVYGRGLETFGGVEMTVRWSIFLSLPIFLNPIDLLQDLDHVLRHLGQRYFTCMITSNYYGLSVLRSSNCGWWRIDFLLWLIICYSLV